MSFLLFLAWRAVNRWLIYHLPKRISAAYTWFLIGEDTRDSIRRYGWNGTIALLEIQNKRSSKN